MSKPENKKCPNCGACQECGHAPTKFVPYPVYPQYYPWWSVTPYTQPSYPNSTPGYGTAGGQTWTMNTGTGTNYIQ